MESTVETTEIKKLNPQTISFSQRSVSECFTDGQRLADVVQKLVAHELSPSDIPSIRVVWEHNHWTALDNRRLRVFKDAGVEEISAIICRLSDSKIKTEFYSKKTNKTLTSGGIIRSSVPFSNKDHFEEGTFVFTKKVLNWNLTQVKNPHASLNYKEPLPHCFSYQREYFNGFPDLILEESRAVLNQGIELIEQNKLPAMQVELIKYKFGKNPENPSPFYFKRKNSNGEIPRAGDVVLLEHEEIRLLGMATYVNPQEQDYQIGLKLVVDQNDREKYRKAFATAYEKPDYPETMPNENNRRWYNPVWNMYPVGSLITHLRMYEACTAKINFPFIENIISGKLEQKQEEKNEQTLEDPVDVLCKDLNLSQKKAIKAFTNLKGGLQLIQGPPGTGKTTTLVHLLKALTHHPSSRVLVSAPSNKAVQLLAERFLEECQDIPSILVGVEDKLPDDLRLKAIFIHTWKKQMLEIITELFRLTKPLQKLLIDKNDNDDEEKSPVPEKQLSEKREKKKETFSSTQFLKIKNAVETLKKETSLFFQRLNFFKLDVSKGFIENWPVFWSALEEYQKLLPDNMASFKCSSPWVAQQRQYLSIILSALSDLQLRFQYQTDEEMELALMNASTVIFATLSVTGRKSFRDKKLLPLEILMIDEAGQAVEAETLIALQVQPKKCLLVGDTKQLPATVISTFSEKLKFDRSLLWRLIEDCQQDYDLLDTQYRMHPEISLWPSSQYYGKQLKNAPNTQEASHAVDKLKNALPFFGPYAFINVEGKEGRGKEHSLLNIAEAEAIENIIRYLAKHYAINIERQVGIITFYKAQAENLSQKLKKDYPAINIKTVDGFQGGENDIIFISFVRANSHHKIGFVSDFRRLNVALTRAKYALIMVGHKETLENSDHDVGKLIKDACERNKIFPYHTFSHLFEKKEQRLPPQKQPYGGKKHFSPKTPPHFQKKTETQISHTFFKKGSETVSAQNYSPINISSSKKPGKQKNLHLPQKQPLNLNKKPVLTSPSFFEKSERQEKVWQKAQNETQVNLAQDKSIPENLLGNKNQS